MQIKRFTTCLLILHLLQLLHTTLTTYTTATTPITLTTLTTATTLTTLTRATWSHTFVPRGRTWHWCLRTFHGVIHELLTERRVYES